ncbi:hypothetical protein ACFQ2B_00375 [Streptomyces stramineus]
MSRGDDPHHLAGVVVITDARYAMLARLAYQWLAEPQPEPIPIGADSGYEDKAIYIAVNHNGNACYCGKTAPTRALNRGPPRPGSASTSTAASRSGTSGSSTG